MMKTYIDDFHTSFYILAILVSWLAPTATSTIFLLYRATVSATGHNVVRFGAGGGGVEDTGNYFDVDDEHTDGHSDTCTWSDVVSRGKIRGRNVQPK